MAMLSAWAKRLYDAKAFEELRISAEQERLNQQAVQAQVNMHQTQIIAAMQQNYRPNLGGLGQQQGQQHLGGQGRYITSHSTGGAWVNSPAQFPLPAPPTMAQVTSNIDFNLLNRVLVIFQEVLNKELEEHLNADFAQLATQTQSQRVKDLREFTKYLKGVADAAKAQAEAINQAFTSNPTFSSTASYPQGQPQYNPYKGGNFP